MSVTQKETFVKCCFIDETKLLSVHEKFLLLRIFRLVENAGLCKLVN